MTIVLVFVFAHYPGAVVGKSSLARILTGLLEDRNLDRLRNRMVPPTTTPPIPPGCRYNNRFYPPNSEIESGEDRARNWCFGTICNEHGQVIQWDEFNCFPTTTPPTTRPPGCFHHGHFYPPGKISEGEDRGSNWCWGYICDVSGHVLTWDNFNCFPTTTPPPTPPEESTTPPVPTTPAARRKKKQLRELFLNL